MASRSLLFLPLLLTLACSSVSAGDADGEGGESSGEGGQGEGAQGEGGQGAECATPPEPETFELGTGETCFTRANSGAPLPMIQGPQGGHHLWLAIGCSDCEPSVHLRWGVRDPETGESFPEAYDSEGIIELTGDGWQQRAGIIAGLPGVVWDPETYPPLAEGTAVRVFVDVLDDQGEVARHDELDVVIGELTPWDPCVEDPNNEVCGFG